MKLFAFLAVVAFFPAAGLAQPATDGCNARAPVDAIHARDKRKIARTPRMDPARASEKFARRFAPLYVTITEGREQFSAREMLNDLWALYPLALAAGDCSPEQARLLAMAATVEILRGYPEVGLVFGEAALRIDAGTHALSSEDAFNLNFRLAQAAGRVPQQHLVPTIFAREAAPAQADKAAMHMREAVRLAPEVADLDQLQRFGLRQSLGYWLFEAGKFAEARDVNLALLADAEKVLDPQDQAYFGVLENLAQVHYELGEPDEARSYLERCLALARKHQQIEIESRMLFQLGVLAHETGDDALARRYMQQRIERVSREDGNADMRAEARASFDELEERILEKR